MLASFRNISIPQDEFVRAAAVMDKIKKCGMTLADLSRAVSVLMPDYLFWFKREASIGELSSLVNKCGYPVGVEWQGIFDDRDEEEEETDSEDSGDDDKGHYAVVTGINTADNWMMLADPYHNQGIDRQMTILEFERRWWDMNEIQDPYTGKWKQFDDYHALFTILPKGDATPELFNMLTEEI